MKDLILVENRTIRFVAFTVFYIAQGFPIGMLSFAMPAWLAGQGVSGAEIAGFIAITTLPWGFKILSGPLMDRFAYLPMGRRRPWIIAAQTGLVLSLVIMGLVPDPSSNIGLLTITGFIVNVFASVQDVAVDGMAIDVLPVNERGRANAFMAGGQVFGYSVSTIISARLLAEFNLLTAAFALAGGVLVILLLAILFRERQGEKLMPWTAGVPSTFSLSMQISDWRLILRNLFRVLILPGSLILLTMTMLYRLADGIFITAAPVIVVQNLGWQDTDYSDWMAIAGGISALFGLMLGPLIDKTGCRKLLIIFLSLAGSSYVLTGLAVDYWHIWYVPLISLFSIQMTLQVVFICVIALHMGICWQRIAATQFALYMAWANLTRSMGAGIYEPVTAGLELGSEFLLMGTLCVLAGIVVAFLNLDAHATKLTALEEGTPASA